MLTSIVRAREVSRSPDDLDMRSLLSLEQYSFEIPYVMRSSLANVMTRHDHRC